MKICVACGAKFDNANWQCPSCRHTPEFIGGYPAFSPELATVSDGFKPGYFAQLANLEASNFWFRSRNRLIIRALERYFPEARNFFEIGCGTGFVLSEIESKFPHLSFFGSEVSRTGLAYAGRRLKRAELFQMDARQIPFADEFDVIGAFDVLEHIREDEQVLRQIYQAVRPGGGVILTVPQHPFLWSHQDDYACHVRRYRARELRTRVEAAGFKVVKMTSFVSLLLPIMILSRLKKRNTAHEFDPMSELKINPLINTLFEKVLDLERWMILLGMSFPAGGSLLLIARKFSDKVS